MSVENVKNSLSASVRKFFCRAEVIVSAKMAIAAALSFAIGQGFGDLIQHPTYLVSGLWCVMASIVVMQSRLGGTYKAVWTRFLGILLGSLAGGIFINFFGDGILSILLGVFITISLCFLLGLKDSVRIAGLSTALIIILGGARPDTNPWTFTFFRFIDSCIGMGVALSVSYFLWPEKALENMRKTTVETLVELSNFYKQATSLEQKDELTESNMVSLRKDIEELLEENRDYCEESELEIFDRDNTYAHWKLFVAELEDLYEMIVIVSRVNQAPLGLIIDDQLAKAVENIIGDTNILLLNMNKQISLSTLQIQEHNLSESIKKLNDELVRFRQTRETRKFNFEDVESYFVYFYSLRTIGNEVLKMEATIEHMQ